MFCSMVLSEVVSIILDATIPVNAEFVEWVFIAKPIPSHVRRFGAFQVDVVMDKAVGSGIVGFDGRRRLWMIKGFEGATNGNSFLAVVEDASSFGFGGRGDNIANGATFCVNGTIRFSRVCCQWGGQSATQVKVACGTTTSIG